MSHCLSCPLCQEVVEHQCRYLEAQSHPSTSCGIICKIGNEVSSPPNSTEKRQLAEGSKGLQSNPITDHYIRYHQLIVVRDQEDEDSIPLAKRRRCDRDADENSFYCHICRLTFLDPGEAKSISNSTVVKEEVEEKRKYKLVPRRNGKKIVIPSFMKQHLLLKKDLPELLIKREVDTEIPEEHEKEDIDLGDNDFEDALCDDMSEGDDVDLGNFDLGEMSECEDVKDDDDDETKVCKICQKELKNRRTLINHMKNVHPIQSQSLKCEQCERVLKNQQSLNSHMRTVHRKRLKRRKCDLTFENRSDMLAHVSNDHVKEANEGHVLKDNDISEKDLEDLEVIDRSEEVTCNICEKVVRNAAKLHLHMLDFHPKERPKCKQCDMTFDNRKAMYQHSMVHKKKEECDLCHNVLRNAKFLRIHVWNVHGKKMPLVCKICQGPQEGLDALHLHMSESHPEERRKCKRCELEFVDRTSLYKHVREIHPREKKGVESVEDATCKICGKFCKLKKYLLSHMRESHSTQTRQCHLCHKVLKHRTTYRHHMQYSHGNREVHCTLCPKIVKSKASLQMHMAYSHAAESINCDLCGSMLKSLAAFRHHMRMAHSTVKLACEICGEVMKNPMSMNAHMKRVHAMTTTRVTCGHCQLSFHNESYLRAHLDMVRKEQEANPTSGDGSKHKDKQNCNIEASTSGRNVNICKTCGISFPCSKTLEEHTNTAHLEPLKDKDHLCQFCGNGYKVEYSLRRHIRERHKQEKEEEETEVGLDQKDCGGGSVAVVGGVGYVGGSVEDMKKDV